MNLINPVSDVIKYRENKVKVKLSDLDRDTILHHCESKAFDYNPRFLSFVALSLLLGKRAEELYGPGGMYGTTPLPGGLYDQMGISSGMRPSTSMTAPSMAAPRSATDNLTDAIKKIKKRAGIIRGTAALVGGDASAADRYEAEAMASLGVYAGQYGMSQLTPADFKDKQTLFQSMLAKNVPLDQIVQVLESGVTGQATGKAELKQIREGSDFVTYQVYPDGSMKEFSRSPISASTPKTELSVDLGKSGDAFGQKLGAIENSFHIPRGLLEFSIHPESPYVQNNQIDLSKELVLFCAAGGRSALAAKTLKDMGFKNVSHIEGGFGLMTQKGFKIKS